MATNYGFQNPANNFFAGLGTSIVSGFFGWKTAEASNTGAPTNVYYTQPPQVENSTSWAVWGVIGVCFLFTVYLIFGRSSKR